MATTNRSHTSHTLPNGAPLNHEPTDVSLTGVTRIAILSWLAIFLVFAVVYGFWKALESWSSDKRELPALNVYAPGKERMPTGPLVLTDEPGALRQHRAKERAVLEHYGWVDKNQGIVRIPIDRAIELLAAHPERIVPGDPPPAAAEPAPAAPGTPQTPPAAGGH